MIRDASAFLRSAETRRNRKTCIGAVVIGAMLPPKGLSTGLIARQRNPKNTMFQHTPTFL